MERFNKRLPFIIALLIPALIYTNWHLHKSNTLSLWYLLDHYGYQQPNQKKALEYLCHEAGIFPFEQSFQSYFPPRKKQKEVLRDMINLVKLTQKNFLLRSEKQERWEVKSAAWMQTQKPETLEALKKLGVVEEIPPQNKTFDVICVLGSTLKSMTTRMRYVENLYNNQRITAKYLVLLAGQRKATPEVDAPRKELAQIAKKWGFTSLEQLTETQLIQEAYAASTLYNKLSTHVIDTPAGNLPRPTTETTTLELIKWLKQNPGVKSILFISNQPFVNYQKAVISEVFKNQNFEISIEVVGAIAAEPLNTQKLVEAIGSYIWAKTPQVLRKAGFKLRNDKILEQLKDLYRNNPLIYQNILS